MKKKWMYYAACGLALFGLAACSSNESADGGSSDKGDGGSLVVYSPNSEGLIGQGFMKTVLSSRCEMKNMVSK